MKKTAILMQLLFFLISCKPRIPENAEKFGPGYDSVRKTIGLPTIQANSLVYHRSGSDFAEFRSDKNAPNPKLEYKSVFWYDTVGMYMERNFYYGPKNDELQVFYGYREFETVGWNTVGFGCAIRSHAFDEWVTISKQQADLTLKKWGIPVHGK